MYHTYYLKESQDSALIWCHCRVFFIGQIACPEICCPVCAKESELLPGRIFPGGYFQEDISGRIFPGGYIREDIISRIFPGGYSQEDIPGRIFPGGYSREVITRRIFLGGLNARNEITSNCRHKYGALLKQQKFG